MGIILLFIHCALKFSEFISRLSFCVFLFPYPTIINHSIKLYS